MVDIAIEAFPGDRAAFAELFALADDSPAAIAAYRDLGTLLVAWDGEAPVGLALVIHDAGAHASEIKSIAVAEDGQGQGIGGRLIEAALDEARRAGSSRIEVSTAAADTANLRFYQRHGFRPARIVRDAFSPATGYAPDLAADGIPLCDAVVLDRPL